MKVVLIRHGQSTNTELASALYADDIGSEQALERAWLSKREVDPQLTAQGNAEVSLLCESFGRDYLSSVLDLDEVTGGGDRPSKYISVAVWASPMLRALQTAQPLCISLDVDLLVDPSLCDVGGHFVKAGGDGRADAPSADEIVNSFAQSDCAVDVTRLPKQGPWDGGQGFETISEARLRAEQVAESLSEMALADEIDVAVLVTHDAFMKLLLTALLLPSSTPDRVARNGLNCEMLNTATTAVDLDPFGAASSTQLLWLNRIDHFLLSARL